MNIVGRAVTSRDQERLPSTPLNGYPSSQWCHSDFAMPKPLTTHDEPGINFHYECSIIIQLLHYIYRVQRHEVKGLTYFITLNCMDWPQRIKSVHTNESLCAESTQSYSQKLNLLSRTAMTYNCAICTCPTIWLTRLAARACVNCPRQYEHIVCKKLVVDHTTSLYRVSIHTCTSHVGS